MAAARRPAPIYMFNRYADMSQLTGEPDEEGWTMLECDSKNAYGCGENIQEAVKGVALYVRLGEAPLINSCLAIRMTDEALGRFSKELELDVGPASPGLEPETTAWAKILMHAEAEGLTIITLDLDRGYYHKLGYNLVYDHKRASLSIVGPVQAPAVTLVPVPRRTCSGDYELFYKAFDRVNEYPFAPPVIEPAPLLCVFSPARAGANPAAAASAWEMRRKTRCSLPESVKERFRADLTFSFQGKLFWVDLSLGLEYCDLDTADAGDGDDAVVDFSYIELPREHVLDLETVMDLYLQEPMEATRTMGCDRDSIWFVCVEESITDDCDDNLVSMWTLKLHGEKKWQWKNEAKFYLRDLWRFDGFKKAGLPELPMEYPLLNAAGGVLYLVMDGEYLGPDAEICFVDHICSFDVRNEKLLWHGTVHNLPVIQPAAFPSCFFQTERVHHPAAGLASLLQPGTGSKVVRSTTALQPGSKQWIISLEGSESKVVRSTTTLQPLSKQGIISLEAR